MSFEDMKQEDQQEMRSLRKLLYRAILELGYIHAMAPETISRGDTNNLSLIVSSEGISVVDEGIKLLGTGDLSHESLPYRLEVA